MDDLFYARNETPFNLEHKKTITKNEHKKNSIE